MGFLAVFSLTTMQDLLSLGNDGRMNYPSRPSGNWVWRMPAYALNELISFRMAELNWLYSRVNE
jgi:4-alpha-glucanotransferase